jgi:hypothetical protein
MRHRPGGSIGTRSRAVVDAALLPLVERPAAAKEGSKRDLGAARAESRATLFRG